MNQMRAKLLERGLVFPKGRRKFEVGIDALLEEGLETVAKRMKTLLDDMRAEWRDLDRRISAHDQEFAKYARSNQATKRLMTVPGIGPLTATALVAAVNDAATFCTARDLAAWLGLVPKQQITGGKPRLPGISRRGNAYLRELLIHGARAALAPLRQRDRHMAQRPALASTP